MTRPQAQRCCDELNVLDSLYVADVEEIKDRYSPGHPAGVRVRHTESGNEMAFARDMDEWRYVFSGIKRRIGA